MGDAMIEHELSLIRPLWESFRRPSYEHLACGEEELLKRLALPRKIHFNTRSCDGDNGPLLNAVIWPQVLAGQMSPHSLIQL